MKLKVGDFATLNDGTVGKITEIKLPNGLPVILKVSGKEGVKQVGLKDVQSVKE